MSSNRTAIETFADYYDIFHRPLTFIFCPIGILFHILNMMVLSREKMQSPTNIILLRLSYAQLMLILMFLNLNIFNVIQDGCVWSEIMDSFQGALYKLIIVNMNLVFHTIAVTLTVVLAVFRYIGVRYPSYGSVLCKTGPARRLCIAVFIYIPIQCIPCYFSAVVAEYPSYCVRNGSVYDLGYASDEVLVATTFWIFGIGFKLIPAILIIGLSAGLVRSLRQSSVPKLNPATSTNSRLVTIGRSHSCAAKSLSERRKTNDLGRNLFGSRSSMKKRLRRIATKNRTTKMLIGVILLCVAGEVPHGLLNIHVGLKIAGRDGMRYAEDVYDKLGDFVEMLALFTNSVSFILYCFMSVDFKKTLINVLRGMLLKKNLSSDTLTSSNFAMDRSTLSNRIPLSLMPNDAMP